MPKHTSFSQGAPLKREKCPTRERPPIDVSHVSQLLTIDQVADRLQVHRTTVYDFINLSGLKVTRLASRAVRIDEADLKVWIEQRKATS